MQCMCTQSYPVLCNPKDCSPPHASVHGIILPRTVSDNSTGLIAFFESLDNCLWFLVQHLKEWLQQLAISPCLEKGCQGNKSLKLILRMQCTILALKLCSSLILESWFLWWRRIFLKKKLLLKKKRNYC